MVWDPDRWILYNQKRIYRTSLESFYYPLILWFPARGRILNTLDRLASDPLLFPSPFPAPCAMGMLRALTIGLFHARWSPVEFGKFNLPSGRICMFQDVTNRFKGKYLCVYFLLKERNFRLFMRKSRDLINQCLLGHCVINRWLVCS